MDSEQQGEAATWEDAQQAVLNTIVRLLKQAGNDGRSSSVSLGDILKLAEAHAWLVSPAQPHGGR